MPNWVENKLQITGKSSEIEVLRDFIEGQDPDGKRLDFDFEKVIPTPKELIEAGSPNRINPDELVEKYGYPDWYEFRVSEWGTKWNLDSDSIIIDNSPIDEENEILELHFDTAWNPPTGIIKHLSHLFPNLTFVMESHDDMMNYNWLLEVSGGDDFQRFREGSDSSLADSQ